MRCNQGRVRLERSNSDKCDTGLLSYTMTLGSKSGGKPSRKVAHSSYKPFRSQLPSRLSNSHISSGKGAVSGSSSSRHVHHTFSKTSGSRSTASHEILTSTKIQERTANDHREYQERIDSMTITERSNIAALRSVGAQAEDYDSQPALDILDILSGQDSVDISHVGGEFADLLALSDDLLGPSRYVLHLLFSSIKTYCNCSRPPVRDYRTRRNRTQRRTEAFARQLPSLVRAYMDWMLATSDTGLAGDYKLSPDADIQGESRIKVIDIFSM